MGIRERFQFNPERSMDLGLSNSLRQYEVEDYMFSRPRQEVISAAKEIARKNLQETNKAFNNPETAILYLSLVDHSLSEGFELSPPFFRQLGLPTQAEGRSATMVTYPEEKSLDASLKERAEDRHSKISRYFDLEATRLERKSFPKLHKIPNVSLVRNMFGITELSELKFSINVLGLSTDEFEREFHAAAFAERDPKGSRIYFPNDVTDDVRFHEYLHTQIYALRHEKFSLFFAGLDEAITEHLSGGDGYAEQVWVLKRLSTANPSFMEELATACQTDDRTELFKMLISQYGLSGFAALARMTPSSGNDEFYSDDIHTVCLSVDEVDESLSKNKLY